MGVSPTRNITEVFIILQKEDQNIRRRNWYFVGQKRLGFNANWMYVLQAVSTPLLGFVFLRHSLVPFFTLFFSFFILVLGRLISLLL
jgi:hypothetical protein